MPIRLKPAAVLGFVMFVSGCHTAPERQANRLDVSVPSVWSASANTFPLAGQKWVESFDDPVLYSLVEQALTSNFDLKTAVARVDAAIAQARIDGAALWPQLSFAPGYQYTQVRSAGFGSAQYSVFEALFNLSWEADIWGRIRSFREAARQEVEATNADFQAARLSLAARVAQNYLHYWKRSFRLRWQNNLLRIAARLPVWYKGVSNGVWCVRWRCAWC